MPNLAPTTYGYDDKSRLTSIARGAQTVGLDYDHAGRRTFLTPPNGVRTDYQYDNASRLTKLIYRTSASSASPTGPAG